MVAKLHKGVFRSYGLCLFDTACEPGWDVGHVEARNINLVEVERLFIGVGTSSGVESEDRLVPIALLTDFLKDPQRNSNKKPWYSNLCLTCNLNCSLSPVGKLYSYKPLRVQCQQLYCNNYAPVAEYWGESSTTHIHIDRSTVFATREIYM